MKKTIPFIFFILLSLIFNSCALKPITPEYTFLKYSSAELVKPSELGNGKILIYNGADALHKIDNTGRLNVWINQKALGQLKPNQFVVIELKKATYNFNLMHIDLVKMRSNHSINIDNETKVIRIEPTLTSNKLEITNILPNNFDRFKSI